MHVKWVHIRLGEIALGRKKNCAYIFVFYYFFITFVIGTVLYLICPLRVSGCGDLVLTTLSETHSRSPQITVLKLFAKTINEFFPLAIFSKKNYHLIIFQYASISPQWNPPWCGEVTHQTMKLPLECQQEELVGVTLQHSIRTDIQ